MNVLQLQSHLHQPDHLKLSMEQLAGLPLSTSGDLGGSGSQGESSGRSTPNSDSAPGKLFVGGLSWQTNQDKLREYFGQFGNVTDVLVMKDPITQRSRGFGFITFSNPEAVDRVLSVPSHCLDGKKIDPKHATPKSKSKANKTKKIFVGGVSQETSSEEVKAYFSQFGKVEEAVMLMDQQTKRHRGFGFVTFENEETVDRVCEIHFHTIKNKKVECKKAQPKEVVQAANTAALLGKRVILSNLGLLPGLATSPAGAAPAQPAQQHHQLSPGPALQAALQQQLAASAALGSYGKLLGSGGPPSISSHRYSPYPLPSLSNTGGGVQYSVSSPLMSQLSAPAVLSPSGVTGPGPGHHQSHLEAAVAAVQPSHLAQVGQVGQTPTQGTNLGAPPGVGVASVSPYQMVDWTSLGYTLPTPMYATL